MKYSLLATDLDGTLLNEDKEIDSKTIEAIHEFRSRGGRVVISSGRSPLSTKWIAETIGLKNEPIIAYNGAVILDEEGKVLEQYPFQNEALLSFLDACQEEGVYAQFYEGDNLLVSEKAKWNLNWIENNIPELKNIGGRKELCDRYREKCQVKLVENLRGYIRENQPNITKIAVFNEGGSLRDFSEKIAQEYDHFEISSSLNYLNLEISPSGITKAASLGKVAEHLGIPLSQTAAIGDNFNDMFMLEMAGLGIAMGNAPDEVKRHADAVTLTNNEGGAGKAIQDYLLF
ncbi:HAD family hydrolase [Neobacillus terrae]|uniref:HAD family hydrolase n=1 Tax=Neobacillus terrae TaxID=3034837 RepID=UPI00140B45E4|nr:HAD family hydrolase [Neobacillus terrae]NHM33747.1 HAD family hydrolase [Neobacillus terrae]